MAKSIFKCKICNEKYTSLEGLYSHLEEEHSSLIPPNMSIEQYYYYLKTGREHGSCVVCKGKTTWNEKTKKYHRFCGDPECKAKYKETVDQRMIGKYGKVNLLNDPEHQRKMLMNRSISGHYNFDGVDKPYVGSYELDFLKTMDLFLNWDPKDIEMPSPHTYYYMYEGEKHFYIPDAFIYSLGLEIEIKDGGNNPNMHHKIQDVDKEKERLKDEVMHNQKLHHYIKLTNKNYWNLFEFFRISKEHVEKYGDYEKIPKIILDEDIGAKKISSNSRSLMKEKASEAINESMTISDRQIDELRDTVSEGFEHIITIGLNKNLKRGLFGLIDNSSYIIYDDKVQLKRVNNIMQPITENFELNDNIEIIRFDIKQDIDINLEGVNKGAYLRWNRKDEIETLLEQISNEWFDSKLGIEDFIRIEDDE